MRFLKTAVSFIVAITMVFLSVPIVFSQVDSLISVTLNGNKGATFLSDKTLSASLKDASLVEIVPLGNTLKLVAKDGAVGIADVTVWNSDVIAEYQVPVGYTTFQIDGDTLTVFDGNSKNYEITGNNPENEEYTAGSDNFPLVTDTDEDGNCIYKNGENYSLNIGLKKKGGSYVVYGKSNDMSISFKKEATSPSVLMLAGLELSSSFTSPVTVKKASSATATVTALKGFVNTLSDVEKNNADIYGDTADGGDGSNAEYAESAVIKGKSNADLIINGNGTLNLNCVTKNAVKVGEYGKLTVEDVTLNVTSADNGLSCDNILNINSGNITVNSKDDGIRSDPDSVDSTLGMSGIINVNGGNITVLAGSDGIQSAQDVNITGGTFNITAGKGYNDSSFNPDTMSCKGIKASFNSDETTDTSESTNSVRISGGTFNLNCADDAIHSDSYIEITKGNFTIKTGDDGIHSDTTLDIGTANGNNNDLLIDIQSCYEGIESGTVNIISGTIDVIGTDDGINAAGGSDSTDGGGGFNPGGGRPPGGGGFNPGGGSPPGGGQSATGFNINISGGNIYINVSGDGIDANGNLNITGGNTVVFGMQSGGDNSPLDCDGSITISGGTVLAAGSGQMATNPSGSSQKYITSKTSISKGKAICVNYNSSLVYSIETPKNVNYVLYSSPDMLSTSGWSITSANPTYKLVSNHIYFGKTCSECSVPAESVVLTNIGSGTVSVSKVTIDSDNFVLTSWNGTIMPGKTNSSVMVAPKKGLSIGEYSATVYITYNNGNIVECNVSVSVSEHNFEKDQCTFCGSYLGDANGDKLVNAIDALMVLQNSVKKLDIEPDRLVFCDVDKVKGITANDSLLILQKSVDMIEFF